VDEAKDLRSYLKGTVSHKAIHTVITRQVMLHFCKWQNDAAWVVVADQVYHNAENQEYMFNDYRYFHVFTGENAVFSLSTRGKCE
jgi:hypothetical protein